MHAVGGYRWSYKNKHLLSALLCDVSGLYGFSLLYDYRFYNCKDVHLISSPNLHSLSSSLYDIYYPYPRVVVHKDCVDPRENDHDRYRVGAVEISCHAGSSSFGDSVRVF